MEPEEMDVVELVVDVPVDPTWRIHPSAQAAGQHDTLRAGLRGMVAHRRDEEPPRFDVEFLDPATSEPLLLATLPGAHLRVVERDTLGLE